MEIAIATAFDANEVKKIIVDELYRRLDQLSPLQGGKEYAEFEANFEVRIFLRRTGEQVRKATLAWGLATGTTTEIHPPEEVMIEETVTLDSKFVSLDPNEERMDRQMPMTVETGDGKGGKRTKKVVVRK